MRQSRQYFRAFMLVLLAASLVSSATAQSADSLDMQVLQTIVVEGVQPDGDTLQNFYKANPSATTENILTRMKGFHLVRRGAYGQEPVFRSLTGGQLNITIDGMKIFGACTDKMDPVTIYVEPQNLSAIQAFPGTEGSAFGSTIGGTLNMKLAPPVVSDQKVTGQAGMDYQTSAQAFNYFTQANLSRTQSAYRISATYRKSGNYTAGGGEIISYSQYEKVNIAAGGKWTIGTYDTLQADVLFDEGSNIGFPALPMDVGRARAGILALTWHRTAPFLIFHNASLKVYHNDISHAMDDAHREDVVMPMDMPGRSRTTGVLADGDLHVFHDHRTTFKAEYFDNSAVAEMTMFPDEGAPMYMQANPASTRRSAGLFVSQHVRFNSGGKMRLSFRGDLVTDDLHSGIGRQQWEVFHPQLASSTTKFLKTFSLQYTKTLGSQMKFEVQSGYGERNATLNERYGYYLFNRFDGYDYLGNPELKNESSWNSEATLQYFSQNIEWEVTPFYQNISHFVIGGILPRYSPMTPGAHGTKQYNNISTAHLAGFDVMMLARPAERIQAIATAKYTRAETSSGDPLPLIPPLKTVTSVRYESKGLHIQAEWEWAAAQHRVNRSSGEQATPAFSLLSLRTGYKINSLFQCNGGIENILDRSYREHLDWGGIPRPGRNFYLNLIYYFSIP